MSVELNGGARVTGLRDGPCQRHAGLRIWDHVGRDSGAEHISLRVLECGPEACPTLRNKGCDEVLFVLSGTGRVLVDGRAADVRPRDGLFVPPGSALSVYSDGPGPLLLASSRCPDPGPTQGFAAAAPEANGGAGPPLARLSERPRQTTADRWYSVMIDADHGSKQITQFVGCIPPGRMPEHFHAYEEVLCILEGEGVMWSGTSCTPIAAGSCVFLPREQPHCVENTGADPLLLLGIFYPAGSPAIRYDT